MAVIGVQDQQLPAALADPLAQADSAHQIGGDPRIFAFGDIPGHDLAAPDIDHQVEVQPDPTHAGRQIGDVPAPDLIRPCALEPWHSSWFLWWPGSTAPVHLAVGVEHAVKAAL